MKDYKEEYNIKKEELIHYKNELSKLSFNDLMGKIAIFGGALLGTSTWLVLSSVDISNINLLPEMIGLFIGGAPITLGISNIVKYQENYEKYERIIDNLNQRCKELKKKQEELKRNTTSSLNKTNSSIVYNIEDSCNFDNNKGIHLTLKRK